MFSYLRPHRRTPSNPASPVPESSHSWGESPLHPPSDHTQSPRIKDGSPQERNSASSPPPTLPPITGLSFVGRDLSAEYNLENKARAHEHDPRSRPREAGKGVIRQGENPTNNSHQRILSKSGQPPEDIKGFTSFDQLGFSGGIALKQKSLDANITATADPQNKIGQSGKRATAAKLPTSPPVQPTISTFEPVQPRGKRLNLLNPMSLLARRRTSQAVTQLAPVSVPKGAGSTAESFDPRIRGTVVHDFSAPRPRRNVSSNDVKKADYKHYQRTQNGELVPDDTIGSPWSGGNHTPVFTENFEEEQYPAAGPHVRKASDISDLPLPKPPYAKGQLRAEPVTDQKPQHTRQVSTKRSATDIGPPVPPKTEPIQADLPKEPVENKRISIDPSSTPPKSSPSKKGRSRNVSEVSAREMALLGLPKHMKSTSSRFSFDMLGAAEQEKILEDRHREKALRKQNASPEGEDYEEDDYDYDNMDDDDGLEERIPGVNADLDDDDFEEPIPGVNTELDDLEEPVPHFNIDETLDDNENIAGFTFNQQTLSGLTSPASPYSPMVSTPRDANGEVIGFAMTKESPYMNLNSPLLAGQQSTTSQDSITCTSPKDQGLGLQNINLGLEAPIKEFPRPTNLDDDDLYFDDGIIDQLGDVEATDFDESVFDNIDTDEYGRPLKTFSTLPTLYSPPVLKEFPVQKEPIDEKLSPIEPISLAPKSSIIAASNGLTQDTLAAYQSALAAAAQSAADSGKFDRESPPENEENQPGLVADTSEFSGYEPFSPSYDDFDYDDALEDDPIIAAANAEALANDMDGFYGQEFGFYSAPAASETQYANGGYFGPRGADALNRSQSGRIALREPNLTPITERSEYSNRNSFMSPLHSSIPPGALNSPGLAQLAGMMNGERDFEGDMSFNALMKLRNRAWGGSQASLHSSTGSPRSPADDTSSPIGQMPPWAMSPVATHRRKNSTFTLVSEETSAVPTPEISSAPASPTLTMERTKSKDGDFKHHKHSGSSESVSYRKEEDPVEGPRWVLERRRTAESGEIELQREVVSGGRI